jgi:predicted PurR-regulated permease PerM
MESEKQPLGNSVKVSLIVIALVVIAFVLRELQDIIVPFVIAYLFYFVFAPLNSALNKKKIPIAVIIILDLIIISILAFGISRLLIESVSQFSENIKIYSDKLNAIIQNAAVSLGIRDQYFRSFSIQKIIAKLDYRPIAGQIFTSAFGISGSIFLVLFFFIFIVGGHRGVVTAFKKRFSKSVTHPTNEEGSRPRFGTSTSINVDSTVQEIIQQIQKYIITKIAMNLLAGIAVGLLTWVLGIDFPLVWGLFTFIFNFIPTLGSAVALVLPALIALLQIGSIGYALLSAGLIAVIQTLVFNFIEPLLVGKRLNLNPIVILLSVLIWGYIWGVVGMLLAVPLTAIIKIIIANSKDKNTQFVVDLMDNEP